LDLETYAAEFANISKWAAISNIILNPRKTRELIVFRSDRLRPDVLTHPIISEAVRVSSLRVLSVAIFSDLGMSEHLDQVLSSCASSCYALRVLRCHGLPTPQLQEVARATTVASLMYASPSWWGFTSAGYRERIERLINQLKRCGFLPMSAPSVPTLANEADQRLFRSVIHNPDHVLHKLLPDVRRVNYNLRSRAHGFELPLKDDRNFISRLLYKDIY